MISYLIDHLEASVKRGDGFSHPFTVRTFSPFSFEFYRLVIENLPPDNFYHDLPHKDSALGSRKEMLIDQNSNVFWRTIASALRGSKVEEIFRNSLGFEGPVTPVARLFRDFSGYKINPHPDSSKKAATIQFYLPADDEQPFLGTSFYSKCSGGFIEEQKLKFLPNSGYCFKVTDSSWHGCNFESMMKPRDTLILTYYKGKQ